MNREGRAELAQMIDDIVTKRIAESESRMSEDRFILTRMVHLLDS